MKIVMGIVWFLILYFVFGVVGGCSSTFIQRAMGISRENVNVDPVVPITFILALVLAIGGTMTGKLPGTKSKK